MSTFVVSISLRSLAPFRSIVSPTLDEWKIGIVADFPKSIMFVHPLIQRQFHTSAAGLRGEKFVN